MSDSIIKKIAASVNKKYGEGAIIDKDNLPKVERISTGSYLLDYILGGGVPIGRIVEIVGGESSGKSTISAQIVANAQQLGYPCAYIDSEQAIDSKYFKALGVDFDENFILSQPDTGEQGLGIVEDLLRENYFRVIIVDSVATLTPEAEIAGEMGDTKMGLHARLMSQALRKINPLVNKSNCCVIFINQYREKITAYGDPRVPTGGNSLKYYASLRIELMQASTSTVQKNENKEAQSREVIAKTLKNKTYPPLKTTNLTMVYGKGIDAEGEIVNLAINMDIIKKAGAWFSYKETQLGHGLEKTKNILNDNPELYQEIKNRVIERMYGTIE